MAVSTTPFFPSSPVGSFEAREVRFHCDHTIAVHLQSAEDVLIMLIAEPRNRKINSITDPTSRERGRGSQTPSGERTEAAGRIIAVRHFLLRTVKKHKKKKKSLPPTGPRVMTPGGQWPVEAMRMRTELGREKPRLLSTGPQVSHDVHRLKRGVDDVVALDEIF